jgi:threonine dehydrogenase-like Zn-dependent dehydrogenase
MDVASLYVMPAVGLFGVDMANPRMGQTVVVHGVGQIGLGVVAACAHRGCRVIAVDVKPLSLAIARQMGADHTVNGSDEDVAAAVKALAPEGADVVFECTGIPACIDPAIALCRPYGKFVWQGNYGAEPVSMHFLSPHGRRLQMFFPCDDGLQPCRRAVIKNMAMGALRWEHCITHRISYTEAPDMYARINAGAATRGGGSDVSGGDMADILGIVVNWLG